MLLELFVGLSLANHASRCPLVSTNLPTPIVCFNLFLGLLEEAIFPVFVDEF